MGMAMVAIILFIALVACWFALPGTASTEAIGKESDVLPVSTATQEA